jgi:hypothetical protein
MLRRRRTYSYSLGHTPAQRATRAGLRAAAYGFVFGVTAWIVVYHAKPGVCILMGFVFAPIGVILRGIIGLFRWAFYF